MVFLLLRINHTETGNMACADFAICNLTSPWAAIIDGSGHNLEVKTAKLFFSLLAIARKTKKVEQLWIKKVRRARICERLKHDLPSSGAILFPTVQNLLHLLPLKAVLGPT